MDNPTTRVLRQEAAFARGLFYISLAPLVSALAGLFLQRFFDVDPAQAPDFAFPLNMPFLAVTYLPQAVIGAAVISAIAAVHALRSTARVRAYIRRFRPDAQFRRERTRP